MSKSYSCLITGLVIAAVCFTRCSNSTTNEPATTSTASTTEPEKPKFGGYETQVKWGEHLVTIAGCNDCHTPKKMTPTGPADDTTLMLSGHPEKLPAPEVDRKAMESKGLVVTADFTAWIGPWGTTYSANLTPDGTGLGNWKEDQFIYAVKNSISKGLAGGRS